MLTQKQVRFIEAYLTSLNGTQAAIRAGYSAKTARAIASENLRKPAIAAEIARRRQNIQAKTDALVGRLIEELARIAFSDITGIFDRDGRIKPPDKWPQETWHAVKSVHYRERAYPGVVEGKRRRVPYSASIKLQDKLWALNLLGEYKGLFPPRLGRRRER